MINTTKHTIIGEINFKWYIKIRTNNSVTKMWDSLIINIEIISKDLIIIII